VVDTRLAAVTLSGRGALTSVGDGLADTRKADLNSKLQISNNNQCGLGLGRSGILYYPLPLTFNQVAWWRVRYGVGLPIVGSIRGGSAITQRSRQVVHTTLAHCSEVSLV